MIQILLRETRSQKVVLSIFAIFRDQRLIHRWIDSLDRETDKNVITYINRADSDRYGTE